MLDFPLHGQNLCKRCILLWKEIFVYLDLLALFNCKQNIFSIIKLKLLEIIKFLGGKCN